MNGYVTDVSTSILVVDRHKYFGLGSKYIMYDLPRLDFVEKSHVCKTKINFVSQQLKQPRIDEVAPQGNIPILKYSSR